MSAANVRPRRSMRNELLSLGMVMALPAAVVAVFPKEPFSFVPAPDAPGAGEAACAFVSLGAEEEAAALANARMAWRVGAEGVRSMGFDLMDLESMQEEPARAVAEVSDRTRPAPPRAPAFDPAPLPPTLAAPPPSKIEPDGAADDDGVAFPRQELLRLD